jgi:DNA-binding MarR family transcriptional regulator
MDPQAADHETRLEAEDHFALKLWLRILTCSNLIEARIRHNLRRDFGCTLPRFDLLAQLDRSEALKMSELSQRLMVTGGNVTGLADQLQDEGWLLREAVEHDRRATRLRLTDAGRERFNTMARTHEAWVIELLGTLTRDEQRLLHGLLGTLKLGLRASASSAEASGAGVKARSGKPARPRVARPARPGRTAVAVARGPSHGTVTPIARSRGKVRP